MCRSEAGALTPTDGPFYATRLYASAASEAVRVYPIAHEEAVHSTRGTCLDTQPTVLALAVIDSGVHQTCLFDNPTEKTKRAQELAPWAEDEQADCQYY